MLARILCYGMIRQLAVGRSSCRYPATMPVKVISQNVPAGRSSLLLMVRSNAQWPARFLNDVEFLLAEVVADAAGHPALPEQRPRRAAGIRCGTRARTGWCRLQCALIAIHEQHATR